MRLSNSLTMLIRDRFMASVLVNRLWISAVVTMYVITIINTINNVIIDPRQRWVKTRNNPSTNVRVTVTVVRHDVCKNQILEMSIIIQ